MVRTRAARWLAPVTLVALGGLLLAVGRPAWPIALVLALLTLGSAWWVWPTRRPNDVGEGPGPATHPHLERRGGGDHSGPVVIYWRPGCQFCAWLRVALGSSRREALWVNIWSDPAGAAFVRGVNNGNETVPTVRIGAQTVWINPSPDRVRAALRTRHGDEHDPE